MSYMEKKSYIEIKVPFAYQADCFDRLRHQLECLPIHWQHDYYHITMAFIDETRCVDDIKHTIYKYFANVPPIKITFDKFDVFTTHSGMHIIHLAASNIPEELLSLNKKIREEIINTGSAIYSDFYLHVTLGRVKGEGIVLDDIRRLVKEVRIQPYTVSLREVVYRYFRGSIISKLILKENGTSSEANVQEEGDVQRHSDFIQEYATFCKYYNGELSCPKEWENDIKGKFWHGEMMFCTSRISIDEWAEQAQAVIKKLKGRKLKFAKSMPLHQFGLVLYIEALFSKWCPYDDMSWIYEY